jgi:hypothetical protein
MKEAGRYIGRETSRITDQRWALLVMRIRRLGEPKRLAPGGSTIEQRIVRRKVTTGFVWGTLLSLVVFGLLLMVKVVVT